MGLPSALHHGEDTYSILEMLNAIDDGTFLNGASGWHGEGFSMDLKIVTPTIFGIPSPDLPPQHPQVVLAQPMNRMASGQGGSRG